MIEKVNPSHPDKLADRIASVIVDYAYKKEKDPKIAVEVLLGHSECKIIIESNVDFTYNEIYTLVHKIIRYEDIHIEFTLVKQDEHLANNQKEEIKCGDNGIFRGVPLTEEDKLLSKISKEIYINYECDGKYILTKDKLIVCQSNATNDELLQLIKDKFRDELGDRKIIINPLGYWTGGYNVDTGATNRKLGSDMAKSVTGGGLWGKDFSKADVSVNIYAFLKAQQTQKEVELYCAIGDTEIDGRPYSEIVDIAKNYVNSLGGFEKFSEWGLF